MRKQMNRIIKISHDTKFEVRVNVLCEESELFTRKKPRITKSLHGVLKPNKQIELVGSFREQCNIIRDINKLRTQSFVVDISQGKPIRATKSVDVKDKWRGVQKQKQPVMKIIPTKVTNDLHLPPGTWKKLGPEPPAPTTIKDLAAKINSLRNK